MYVETRYSPVCTCASSSVASVDALVVVVLGAIVVVVVLVVVVVVVVVLGSCAGLSNGVST